MAVKTQADAIFTTVDPLSLHYGLEIVSGGAVQTYNNETKEYEPDRTLVPLIVAPYVEASDPEGRQNGRQSLTGVEWYDGAPKADYSNRIAAGTDYEIGDGTAEGFPKDALKVKKNVSPDAPMQVFCVAKFTDERTGETVRTEMGMKLYTAVYESRNYKVALDCPSSWTVNPLKETTWEHTVTAQLYSGKEAVADDSAAYWWEVMTDGDDDYHAPTEDDEELWIKCRDAGGNYTKTATVDARMFRTAKLRVRAAWYDGERPSAPESDNIQAETLINVEMPHSLKIDQIQTRGARMASDFSTTAGYEVTAYDNRSVLTDAQIGDFLDVRWKAKSAKAGSSEVALGSGKAVEFVPKDKGFDPKSAVAVWAEAGVYGQYVVLTDDDGAVLTDDDGAALIAPEYE